MSWFDYIFDSDHRQRRDLLKHEDEIRYLRSSLLTRLNDLEVRFRKLEHENAELKSVCLALLHTLIDHNLVTQESFVELAQQIDKNGRQNGQDEGGILPKPKSPSKSDIKIDFSSARQRPESLDS